MTPAESQSDTIESDTAGLHVPPEIVEQILQHCRADLPTLKASSMVDRSFCEMSQKQIFHTVTLTLGKQVPGISTKLATLLDSSPHLSNYIRALCINLTAKTLPSDSTDTSHILPRLRNLASISLIRSSLAISSIYWTRLESKFRVALLDAFRSPLISSINITGVNGFPIGIVASCPSLKHLSFLLVYWFDDQLVSNLLTTLKPKLTSLVLQHPWRYLPRLGRTEYTTITTAMDLSHLQTFALYSCKTGGPELVNHFIESSSTCLEKLIVYLVCPSIYSTIYTTQTDQPPKPHLSSPLHTGTLFKLTTLVIIIRILPACTPEEGRGYRTPIPWVLAALEALPEFPSNSLLTFTLYIEFRVDHETFARLDWEDFNRILLSPNLSGLREVQMCVSGEYGPLDTLLENLLKEDNHLSKLIEKELLMINNSEPLYDSLQHDF